MRLLPKKKRADLILSTKQLSFLGVTLLGLMLPSISEGVDSLKVSASDLYLTKFLPYKEMITKETNNSWPEIPVRSSIPAQIEQETCASARSKMCWSPYAELKTEREYGFGWGQLTVTQKFDNFKEAKKLHPSLKDWTWENRYNATYQLRTMILMNLFSYNKIPWADSEADRMAFTFAAYNGGLGGVLSDRAVCRVTSNCQQGKWFGQVELTSKKARTVSNGYGKGFYFINREYVRNILCTRNSRYQPYFNESYVILGCSIK